jgi:hypothetical protein
MDAESIRSRLTELWEQYNSQVTHEDPSVRKDAEKMLMVIAKARQRHLGIAIAQPQRGSRGRLSIRGLLERIGWLSRN